MSLEHLNEMRRVAGLPQLTEAPLSRVDVDANIQLLLEQITQLASQVVEASQANIQAPEYGTHDKWGIQGNLVKVRTDLRNTLQFISNGKFSAE